MAFDLEKILQSKRELRQKLAARPVAEKLAMLDALRKRALALRAAAAPSSVPAILKACESHRRECKHGLSRGNGCPAGGPRRRPAPPQIARASFNSKQ